MRNKFKYLIVLLTFPVMLSSCLKAGLEDFPEWDVNDISNVYVEFRYNSNVQYWSEPIVAYKRLTVTQTIDKTNKTVAIAITVPAASGSFTTDIRNTVTQDKLIPYFDISTAASMQGTDGTANPGNISDLTKPLKYKVTAANGSSAIWTITVTSFTK